MAAGVDERAERSLAIARHDERDACVIMRDEVAGRGDLRREADDDRLRAKERAVSLEDRRIEVAIDRELERLAVRVAPASLDVV
jgi:hypothetical protein